MFRRTLQLTCAMLAAGTLALTGAATANADPDPVSGLIHDVNKLVDAPEAAIFPFFKGLNLKAVDDILKELP